MSLLGIFVMYPWLALVTGLAFGVAADRSRRVVVWITAVAWVLYGLMEFGMQRRILCTGECNIRVDLILIYPVLLGLSIVAVVATLRARPKTRRSRGNG